MSKRTIYIVDDDDPVRDSLRALLGARSNLRIQCYNSGSAFVEQVAELEPGVLMLDYHMPGLTGVEVLRSIDRNKFMTIMLTGHANVGLAMEVIRAGAVDFLEKPYEGGALLQTIETAFEKLEQDSAAANRVVAARAKIERLTDREKEVLECLIRGYSNKLIAYELEISPRTVEIHRAHMMEKLEVRSLSEALRITFAAGMVPVD